MYSIPSLRAVLSKTGPAPVTAYPFYTNGDIEDQITVGDDIYIGGSFTTIGKYSDLKTNCFCILNSTTAAANYTSISKTLFNGNVLCSLISGNYIYVGGSFTVYNNQPALRFAKISLIDGSLDTTFNTSTGFDAAVEAIAIDGSGNIYAGGSFTSYKGTTRQYLAKLNGTTAALDLTFDVATGPSNIVYSITIDGSGSVYIGGNFLSYKGTTRQYIAKLNGATAALDTAFDAASGFNGTVYSMILDGSGGIYVGGGFSTYKTISRQYIAKINTTTAALDTTFNSSTGFDSIVRSMALDGSGNLYAGGIFTTYKSTARQYIAKLNATTAALDTTFDSATGFNNSVYSIIFDVSGNIYAGGPFTSYKSTTRQYVAKVNSTTAALNTTFDSASGFNGIVSTLALDVSGNIYAGGSATNYKTTNITVTRQYIAKISLLNGNIDSTFNSASGFDNTVYSLAHDGAGNIYAGGGFFTYKGVSRQYIAKINATTAALDTTFNSATGFDSIVEKVILDGAGYVYAAGSFTAYKGLTRQRIAKLNASTAALDATFNSFSGFNNTVTSIALDGSGNLYACGSFTSYKSITRQCVAKINAATAALDTTFDTTAGFSGSGVSGYHIYLDQSGDLILNGFFTQYKGYSTPGYAKLNAVNASFKQSLYSNGAVRFSFNDSGNTYLAGDFTSLGDNYPSDKAYTMGVNGIPTSIGMAFNGQVFCCLKIGNYLYVGGSFTEYKGTPRQRIAKISLIDGSLDSTFDTASGFANGSTGDVNSIVSDGAGNIYVGGNFITYKGTTRQYIAKLNGATAALDSTFDAATGFNSTVRSAVIDGSGNIYVAGNFTTYKGTTRQRIAKLNTTTAALDATFDSASGFDFDPLSITLDGSGNLYAGGLFSTYKGTTRQRIAKLNATTAALDTTFNTASGFGATVNSIALDGAGNLYAGGLFTDYKTVTRQRIAKINATTAALDTTFDTVSGFNGQVNSISLDGAGNIYVGGSFLTYKGAASSYIAKLNATTAVRDSSFSSSALSIPSSGLTPSVSFVSVIDSNTIFAGGTNFIASPITTRQRIGVISQSNGNLSSLFNSSSGFNSGVYNIILKSGVIYAGGAFTVYGNYAPLNRSAVLDSTTGQPKGY